jgi:esterase/lipase superfamily enzyme
VFVHGYRNSFPSALIQTAQLAADLDIDGPSVAYSWPSKASLLSYMTDSTQDIETFVSGLTSLIERTVALQRDGERWRLYLIAHSLGAKFLLRALRNLKSPAGRGHAFAEIVFASPDVDAVDFDICAPQVTSLARRVTVYVSKNDKALKLSGSKLIHGRTRAGGAPDRRWPDGFECVDTSAVTQSFIGHSDYAETAIDDVRAVVWLGLTPLQRRAVLTPVVTNGASYWAFEQGIEDRLLTPPFRRALSLIRDYGPEQAWRNASMLATPAMLDRQSQEDAAYWREVAREMQRILEASPR